MRLVAAVLAMLLFAFVATTSHACGRATQADAASPAAAVSESGAPADSADGTCPYASWSPDSQADQDDRGEALTGDVHEVRLPVLPQARADALTRGVPSPWLPGLLRPPRRG